MQRMRSCQFGSEQFEQKTITSPRPFGHLAATLANRPSPGSFVIDFSFVAFFFTIVFQPRAARASI